MTDLIGQNLYKGTVRQLEPTDPAAPTTWNPIHQDLVNNDAHLKALADGTNAEVIAAREGKASLLANVQSLRLSTLSGSSTFAGPAGQTITHNLGHTNYRVRITPTVDPAGYLGEDWVVKSANTFVVYNSGKSKVAFDWQILT